MYGEEEERSNEGGRKVDYHHSMYGQNVASDEANEGEKDDGYDVIELTGCGKISQWRFPKDLERCPISSCQELFDDRFEAIDHYRKEHAKNSILCYICAIPIYTYSFKDFEAHFNRMHPNDGIPFQFNQKIKQEPQPAKQSTETVNEENTGAENQQENSIPQDDNLKDDADKDDDLITLSTSDQVSHWRFPQNTSQCPVKSCQEEFDSRSDAIAHYKHEHADKAIFCPPCNKPIAVRRLTQFLTHFHKKHPFKKNPYDVRGKEAVAPEKSSDQNDKENSSLYRNEVEEEEVDDLITLEGSGHITQWRFPSNITRCPVHNCRETFEVRSAGIAHYKEKHAKGAILCLLCDKPIYAPNVLTFVNHYRDRHQGEQIPYDFNKKSTKSQDDQTIQNENVGGEDDLITLNGLGQSTQWRFPQDMTCCPVRGCQREYGVRSLAIAHYIHRHAKNSVFCIECDKPVAAKCPSTFIMHYSKFHPDIELPAFLKKPETETDESDNEVDDTITLRGCGQVTQWRFPKKIKCCPVRSCSTQFEHRSKAISHYRKHHAKNYIFCSICEKPIATTYPQDFVRHYDIKHPGIEVPFNYDIDDNEEEEEDLIKLKGGGVITEWRFPQNTTRCPLKTCTEEFGNRSMVIGHFKFWHAPYYLFCPICDKLVAAHKLKNYKEHFENVHPHIQEIPSSVSGNPIQSEGQASETDESDNNEDEVDDLITLRGCGQITQWKFPDNLTNCPIAMCPNTFHSRSKAINHYRQKHAHNAILCPICDKPVAAHNKHGFIVHYEKWHAYQKVPYNFCDENLDDSENPSDTTVKIGASSNGADENAEEVDDLITLEGCGQITQWRFPPKLTRCPINSCTKAYEFRSAAISHYKKIHAPNSIVCAQCGKPVVVTQVDNFIRHYRDKHPGIDLPSFMTKKVNSSGKDSQTDQDNVNADEVDDMITLTGFGQIAQWQFPQNATRCPVRNCQVERGFRSLAIDHYRKRHAKNFILCGLCNKPIPAKSIYGVIHHYKKIHPNVTQLPSFLTEQEPELDSDEDDVDDLITLGGGDQITHWHFPKGTKRCPIHCCGIECRTRPDAITHYRNFHTSKSIFCSICDKPVAAIDFNAYVRHYTKYHPNLEVPSKVEEEDMIILKGGSQISRWQFPQHITKCPARNCTQEFVDRAEAIAHYRKRHAMNYQYCSKCDKLIPTHHMKFFSDHYRNVHPNKKDRRLVERKESDTDEENDWITLTGDGQITQWQFPKKTKICPVRSCLMHFGVRSDAIDHYRKRHAMNYIYCSKCDKPISTHNIMDFNEHYRRVHPNEPLPNDFGESLDHSGMDSSQMENVDSTSLNVNVSKIDECDLIELIACGQVTQWRFPKNIKHCPFYKCEETFDTRLDAIAHYKQQHAKGFILCSICQKPIRARTPRQFKSHYLLVHPTEPLPLLDDESPSPKSDKIQIKPNLRSSNKFNVSNEMDDWILLEGCGQLTQWKFPAELKVCPVKKCGIQFTVRSDAIVHYKNLHAKDAILCSICDVPIYAEQLKDLEKHHHGAHPDEEFKFNQNSMQASVIDSMAQSDGADDDDEDDVITLSGCGQNYRWKFPKDSTKCPIKSCLSKFEVRSNAIDHYKKCHAMNAMYCIICDKPIATQGNVRNFKSHYNRMHPGIDTESNFDNESTSSEKSSPQKRDFKPSVSRDVDDESKDDDLITLSGCGLITQWRFPLNLTSCPVLRCRKLNFTSRADAIAHYKLKHAKDAIFCYPCNKPIAAFKRHIFKMHYDRIHQNIKDPFSGLQSAKANETADTVILGGCGQITQWRFPKTKRCPVIKCSLSFDNRLAALNHYKRIHAQNAIFCNFCNKPVGVSTFKALILHFRKKHPGRKIPFSMKKPQSLEAKPIVQNDEDLITLWACGETTQWRFPADKTECPVLSCKKRFEDRRLAIDHYKTEHAMNSFYCSPCGKPLRMSSSFDMTKHFQHVHPGLKVPLSNDNNRSIKIEVKSKSPNPNKKKVKPDQENDLITLEGYGIIKKWRFPKNTTDCPVPKCKASFKNRSAAIAHYKEVHAKLATRCPICEKVIYSCTSNLKVHMQRVHPEVKNYKMEQQSVDVAETKSTTKREPEATIKQKRCKMCGKSFANLSRHMHEVHSSTKMFCPLKDCTFTTKRMDSLRDHWKRLHGDLRFPEIRYDSGFTYTNHASSDDEDEKSNKRSASDSLSDMESDSQPKSKRRRINRTGGKGRDQSLLEPLDSDSSQEPSSDDDSSKRQVGQKIRKPPSSRKSINSSATSRHSSDALIHKQDAKRPKLVDRAPETEVNKSNTSGPIEASPRVKMLANMLPRCSVTLETNWMDALQQYVDPGTSNIVEPSNQSQNIVLESPNAHEMAYDQPEVTQEYVEALEPEIQMSIGTFEPFVQATNSEQSTYNDFDVDLEPPDTLIAPNHLSSIIEVHPGNEFNENEQFDQKPTELPAPDVVYVIDSDEEDYAFSPMHSTNSSSIQSAEVTHDQEQYENSLHVRTYGVLMMKKEPK